MTASAGAATAAPEELGAAAPGETAEAEAVIVIVSRDAGTRQLLRRELSKRYGGDYQIVACDRPAELEPWMRDLRAAGLPVALVIGGVGAQDRDGIEVLSAIRPIDPAALRVAAVGWGDWQAMRPVFDAVTVGALDHWLYRPAQAPAEEFHRAITEFLREWSSQQGGGPQVPHPGCQIRGPVADHDLIVAAIPLGHLPVQDLPGATVTADDDDGRLCRRSFTAHGGA